MTKNSPARATDAHISIVGHITADELARRLDATDMANGFGNRFPWVSVSRSKLLPDGGRFDVTGHSELIDALTAAIKYGGEAGYTPRDDEAARLWQKAYPKLTRDRPGVAGDTGTSNGLPALLSHLSPSAAPALVAREGELYAPTSGLGTEGFTH